MVFWIGGQFALGKLQDTVTFISQIESGFDFSEDADAVIAYFDIDMVFLQAGGDRDGMTLGVVDGVVQFLF